MLFLLLSFPPQLFFLIPQLSFELFLLQPFSSLPRFSFFLLQFFSFLHLLSVSFRLSPLVVSFPLLRDGFSLLLVFFFLLPSVAVLPFFSFPLLFLTFLPLCGVLQLSEQQFLLPVFKCKYVKSNIFLSAPQPPKKKGLTAEYESM